MARRDTAARRYAEAAFELGRAGGTLERWQEDLERLRAVLANDEVREVIEHPGVAYAEKEKVLRRIAGDVSAESLSLVLLMVRRGRPRAIGAMVERFRELVRRERGVALAEVRTTMPLDEAQREMLTEHFRRVTNQQIEINEVVDESLIGGITVRIGDQLYDASVRTRLERLRSRLTAI